MAEEICTGCQNLWLHFNGLWKSLSTFYRATKTFCHKSLNIQETKTEKKRKNRNKTRKHYHTFVSCTYTFTHLLRQVCIYTFIFVFTHTHTQIHKHIHIYIYTYIYICIYTQEQPRLKLYTVTKAYMLPISAQVFPGNNLIRLLRLGGNVSITPPPMCIHFPEVFEFPGIPECFQPP